MPRARSWRRVEIFALGHSTRSVDELVALLRAHGVEVLADIRTVPRSRHNPQFEKSALAKSLHARGIRYEHLASLGGLRKARRDSPNKAWHNASFRGYADYMQTEGFEAGLSELRALADEGRVAIMCAEAVPWRCHRSLVADVLTVRGAKVFHIESESRARPHTLTRFARVQGTRVIYPPDPASEGRLPTAGPFHLEATVRVLQRRPTNVVERFESDRYLRVRRTSAGLVRVAVANEGTLDEPDLRFTIDGAEDTPELRLELAGDLRKVLGLDLDPEPIERVAQSVRALRTTTRALRGMRPPRFIELFEAFANVVPFQQVSLDAGLALTTRLVQRFGEQLDGAFAFPTAASVANARLDTLRSLGLSRTKAQSLLAIARLVADGTLTEAQLAPLSSADAIARLKELPGIGPWSAALVLLRGLGRLDVFPPGDAGIARGLGAILGKTSVDSVAERFGDLRGYLYFCTLGASLLGRGLITPASV